VTFEAPPPAEGLEAVAKRHCVPSGASAHAEGGDQLVLSAKYGGRDRADVDAGGAAKAKQPETATRQVTMSGGSVSRRERRVCGRLREATVSRKGGAGALARHFSLAPKAGPLCMVVL
jgi:hypothetical protein